MNKSFNEVHNYMWLFVNDFKDKWKIISTEEGVYAINDKNEYFYLGQKKTHNDWLAVFREKIKVFYESKGKPMSIWSHLKAVKTTFQKGYFSCPNGLTVEITGVGQQINLRLGGTNGQIIGVNKETAETLSNFFKEISESLA